MLLIALQNHLLAQSTWASQRLRDHAGKCFCLAGGPLRLRFQISEDGSFAAASAQQDDVTITLPADTPLRLLTDRSSIFAGANLQGSADFAETLGFVFRNLRWDAEADLARFTGDILAYRLLRALSEFFSWQQNSLENTAANLGEFLTEETSILPLAREYPELKDASAILGHDLASLEARIARLG